MITINIPQNGTMPNIGKEFELKTKHQKFCSRYCATYSRRKVFNRPTKEILFKQIKKQGFINTGKLYGVSDNTIRKWLK